MVPSQTLVHAKSHKLKVKINSKSKSEHEIVISIEKENPDPQADKPVETRVERSALKVMLVCCGC
uniref:Uncharacterized protein n=1 Tax=Helianthus annuus TaxID=4232 RepID=A0A251SYS7_HELAN